MIVHMIVACANPDLWDPRQGCVIEDLKGWLEVQGGEYLPYIVPGGGGRHHDPILHQQLRLYQQYHPRIVAFLAEEGCELGGSKEHLIHMLQADNAMFTGSAEEYAGMIAVGFWAYRQNGEYVWESATHQHENMVLAQIIPGCLRGTCNTTNTWEALYMSLQRVIPISDIAAAIEVMHETNQIIRAKVGGYTIYHMPGCRHVSE